MPGSSANVTSLDVIREFRVAMLEFEHDMQDALQSLTLEARRAQDWVENDRASYWAHPKAAREASDRLIEAKNLLEQCQLAARVEDRRSCIDEKKAVERAKRRVQYCEEKVQRARFWKTKIRQEAEEFLGSMAKLSSLLETDTPRAVALLERFIIALEKYTTASEPPPSGDALTQSARDLESRDQ